jgi:hypothetical protein
MSTVSFDADSIKSRLKERLQAKESWKNMLFYSTNNRLIDIFAEELAYDMQYDEILTTEAKWGLAQQLSSIMAETQFFNYIPHRKVGASGNLRVSSSSSFSATYGTTIEIPKYSVFTTGTYDFVCTKTTDLSIYDNYVDIPITQGTPKSVTFTAEGTDYETFEIDNNSIEDSIIDVYVNGVKWTQIDYIREAVGTNSQNYVIKTLNDFSGITIKFGNDYYGKKLSVGDTVLIKYLETSGVNGNVESSGVITTVSSTIYDINSNEVTLYCNNTEAISGGKDIEDIEDIRVKAPRSYQTGDRAISKSDYESLIEEFSFVKKATVWGETEINADNGNIPGTYISSEENMVHVSVISSDNGIITDDEETEIRDTLNEKKPPTDIVKFENPIFNYIYFTIVADVLDTSYTLSNVKAGITSALKSTYSIDNLNFKQTIRYSDYISLVDGVDGVDFCTVAISYYMFEIFNDAYTADIELNMLSIKANSLKIYVKDTSNSSADYVLIGTDNGLGNIIGEAGYTFSASTINYDTGIGNIIITAGLVSSYSYYTIKIAYSTTVDNIIPTVRNQIISYGDSSVTTEYED